MTQSIEFREVSVEALRKNPWNTNQCSPDTERKIRNSLERNGMFKPIIVREVEGLDGWEILGGQHRWEQAIELGHATVPVANLGPIDDIKAKEIGVIDNARYGVDDSLAFAELLKEIGDADDLQNFLPYGQSDLDLIFASSTIALDDLDALEISEDPEKPEPASPKQEKTHTIVRFKVPLGDAERLTALIASTKKTQGFTASDDLTNAGDALVHLLSDQMPEVSDDDEYSLDNLDELELALQEDQK